MATGNGIGGVFLSQMSRKAKTRIATTGIIDLASAASGQAGVNLMFSYPEADVAIVSIKAVYAIASGASSPCAGVKIGTVADDDAFATSQSIGAATAVNAIGDSATVTLNTTSCKTTTSPNTHASLPVLPAGTAMILAYTNTTTAGSVKFVISYFPLDD